MSDAVPAKPRPKLALVVSSSADRISDSYFREMRSIPTLPHDQIVAIYQQVEIVRAQIEALRGKEDDESLANVRALRSQEDDLINRVVTANLRLAALMAKRYVHSVRKISLLDLVQEANMGLMRAARLYDYRMGFRFTTFSTPWVVQALMNARDADHTIHVPRYVVEFSRKIHRTAEHLHSRGGDVSEESMGDFLGRPPEWIEKHRRAGKDVVSLNDPIKDNMCLEDVIGQDPDTDRQIEMQDMRREIERALAVLKPRERNIIERRFGLGGWPAQTHREIGKHLDLSHERIRQIEMIALRRIRTSCEPRQS